MAFSSVSVVANSLSLLRFKSQNYVEQDNDITKKLTSDEEVMNANIELSNSSIVSSEIKVLGMSCNHCVDSVKKAVFKLEGVKSVEVELIKNKATIKYDTTNVSLDNIINAVTEAGFEAIIPTAN